MAEQTNENEYGHAAGDSILLIPLPELNPHLAPWIEKSSSDGISAHITVLVPFLPEAELTDDVLAELRGIFSGFTAFDVTFQRTARFPEVLYLAPEPDQPVKDMTTAVYERWPQCPPYGGDFEDLTPHTTVVHVAETEAEYDEAARLLAALLPLRTWATAVHLLVFDGGRWNLRERFLLARS